MKRQPTLKQERGFSRCELRRPKEAREWSSKSATRKNRSDFGDARSQRRYDHEQC